MSEEGRSAAIGRRTLLGTALLAGLGGGAAPASAAAVAKVVTPNPVKRRIARSGLAVGLAPFGAPPRTAGARPYALLNYVHHAGDGSGHLFACDSRGVIWRLDPATGAASTFLDLRATRPTAFLPGSPQMGLRSFAFHPDHARPGAPGFGKLYTATTETIASRPAGVRLFGGPFKVVHDGVVAEWTVRPDDPNAVDPSSRRELFRVAQYKRDHQLDQVLFNPNNDTPGRKGYGRLFVTVGDGGNVPERPDPYDLAQDPLRAHGKVLRVDPLTQPDGAPYGIPADNPFVRRTGWLPEIWALGLRHPLNLAVDRGGVGAMLLTDIGQANVEEVNILAPGANYGWPLREGTFATDRRKEATLRALPTNDARLGLTYPVAQYDHHEDGRRLGRSAIVGGHVYRGSKVPALAGQYVFGDMVSGRVFHVAADQLAPGRQAVVWELTLREAGREVTLLELTGSTNGRVDLRFGQDEDGELYIVTKQDGVIRRVAAA